MLYDDSLKGPMWKKGPIILHVGPTFHQTALWTLGSTKSKKALDLCLEKKKKGAIPTIRNPTAVQSVTLFLCVICDICAKDSQIDQR